MNICPTFHIYFPIWAKLIIVDRHIMLLSVYGFHEKPVQGSPCFPYGPKGNYVAVYVLKACDIVKAKNASVKSVCCFMV
jgi:hypothetical protein